MGQADPRDCSHIPHINPDPRSNTDTDTNVTRTSPVGAERSSRALRRSWSALTASAHSSAAAPPPAPVNIDRDVSYRVCSCRTDLNPAKDGPLTHQLPCTMTVYDIKQCQWRNIGSGSESGFRQGLRQHPARRTSSKSLVRVGQGLGPRSGSHLLVSILGSGSGSGFRVWRKGRGITAARLTSPSDAAAAEVRRTDPVELGGRVMSSCRCTTTCGRGAGSGVLRRSESPNSWYMKATFVSLTLQTGMSRLQDSSILMS